MKDIYIADVKYYIEPRMKKRWFRKDKKVYDLKKYTEGERWCDITYGNGGGDYRPFYTTKVIYSFDNYDEADTMKGELERDLNLIEE